MRSNAPRNERCDPFPKNAILTQGRSKQLLTAGTRRLLAWSVRPGNSESTIKLMRKIGITSAYLVSLSLMKYSRMSKWWLLTTCRSVHFMQLTEMCTTFSFTLHVSYTNEIPFLCGGLANINPFSRDELSWKYTISMNMTTNQGLSNTLKNIHGFLLLYIYIQHTN